MNLGKTFEEHVIDVENKFKLLKDDLSDKEIVIKLLAELFEKTEELEIKNKLKELNLLK